MIKIGLDVMGGDFAPEVTVLGAISAFERLHRNARLVLVGDAQKTADICINVLIDVGLNPDCKPDVLCQYGLLGSLYAEFVHDIPNPRVALLNIGSESEKGNLLTKSTYPLMAASKNYNFIGNIEGHEIFLNTADVIVCNGFVGNVILKTVEGFSHIAKHRGIDDEYFEACNPDNYGGTPVLGINSNVVIGHGASNSIAIKNMILLTQDVIEADLPSKIKKYFIQR